MSNSPYSATPKFGRFVFIDIPPDINDEVYIVENQFNERPDKLAYERYGSSELWWIFSVRNPELRRDPFFGLKAGMEIIVPSRRSITQRGNF